MCICLFQRRNKPAAPPAAPAAAPFFLPTVAGLTPRFTTPMATEQQAQVELLHLLLLLLLSFYL